MGSARGASSRSGRPSAGPVSARDPASVAPGRRPEREATPPMSQGRQAAGTRDTAAFSPAEVAAMRRALHIARTSGVPLGPNPRVGCVLLDDAGQEVAEGFHRGAGSLHAEADALARAGGSARGSTAVVTLEPCNHTGRTGPCAGALVAAGVRRVIFAQPDGNPVAVGGA